MSAVMVSMAVLIRTFSSSHTHAACLFKLCVPPSNGIVKWRLFTEFGAELTLENCTPKIILNNPVFFRQGPGVFFFTSMILNTGFLCIAHIKYILNKIEIYKNILI